MPVAAHGSLSSNHQEIDMKTAYALMLAAAFAWGAPMATAQTSGTSPDSSMTNPKDHNKSIDRDSKKFFEEAAIGGMAEVELGKLASQKAASADVKQFGETMVKDHTAVNEQLATLAQQDGVTLPTEVDAKHKKLKDKLAKKEGAAFDKAYMDEMVKDHKKDISLFEKEAKKGDNTELKSFAQQTLPKLQEHLKMAQQTQKTLK
jgi:putative membrane protein